MRILGISPNFNQNRNVNFGWFRDDNARKVVKETLTTKAPDYLKFCSDTYFERIESCDYFEAYTSESGTVKGKFDDEFVRSNGGKQAEAYAKWIQKDGTLENLETFDNIEDVASTISKIDDIFEGIDPADKHCSLDSCESTENYASMRAEEEAYR